MTRLMRNLLCVSIIVATLGAGSTARAQSADRGAESPWSAEFGMGGDHIISGNINSSGVGRINNQEVVVSENRYEDVYGTGLHLRFGGGYVLTDAWEATSTFSFESLGANPTPIGDIGVSRLFAQYADHESFGVDVGLRRYTSISSRVRAYGEGTLGLAFVDDTDIRLVSPQANLSGTATEFYDGASALTFGGNIGVLVRTTSRVGIFGQVGLRWVDDMSAVNGPAGTGFESLNDNSARWTFPFLVGVRTRF